jgi:hypothetical protein
MQLAKSCVRFRQFISFLMDFFQNTDLRLYGGAFYQFFGTVSVRLSVALSGNAAGVCDPGSVYPLR